jgi:4-alpha-glucanotransferase
MDALSQLFYLHGIGAEYTKYTGERQLFSAATRKRAVECCGVNTDDSAQIEQLNYALDAAQWLLLVPNISLVERPENLLKVRIAEQQREQSLAITIAQLELDIRFEQLTQFTVLGEYRLNDIRYIEIALPLPKLPIGYHDAQICVADKTAETQIWSVPEQAYQPDTGKRVGLSLQLYSLKNAAGLGIGDFADLLTLASLCGDYNIDYILLNPLHLLFGDNPERASPYNPNNRALLNPLYIAIDLSEDSKHNPALTSLMRSNEVSQLSQNSAQFIDYNTVSAIKYRAFKALFTQFQRAASTARQHAFKAFCQRYHDTLTTLNAAQPLFAYYLQWQAHIQLAQCQQRCIDSGMAIGLINDLAVGCAKDGSEFNSQQHLFSQGATVGAPPDPWAEHGQDWGLPAINPQKIADHNFQYYRALIRANMQQVGGLRIDHVMAIRRLWWCFENQGVADGCYVYYPFEPLLAILKIESHLNHTVVIGEDLGIVPPEVKAALSRSGIFSNSLFYFEKQQNNEFIEVHDLAPHCLLMIANHDVPPFTGWWQHDDLKIKLHYKLLDEQQLATQRAQRVQEQQCLLRFINRTEHTALSINASAITVYSKLAQCLAGAPSQLFTLQLDDLDQQRYPVNIPGTDTQYPNWRRVLTHTCEDIFNNNASLLATINSIRKA